MIKSAPRRQLVQILQKAYSGELAAAYAYRGHWKSLGRGAARERIKQIEHEEWEHRRRLGLMLGELGAAPVKAREVVMRVVGRTAGVLCHLTGRFLPMYLAGRLESGNVAEYELAASHAGRLGLTVYEDELFDMAGVEKEHEIFFIETIADHRLLPLMESMFGWGGDSPRETKRRRRRSAVGLAREASPGSRLGRGGRLRRAAQSSPSEFHADK